MKNKLRVIRKHEPWLSSGGPTAHLISSVAADAGSLLVLTVCGASMSAPAYGSVVHDIPRPVGGLSGWRPTCKRCAKSKAWRVFLALNEFKRDG